MDGVSPPFPLTPFFLNPPTPPQQETVLFSGSVPPPSAEEKSFSSIGMALQMAFTIVFMA